MLLQFLFNPPTLYLIYLFTSHLLSKVLKGYSLYCPPFFLQKPKAITFEKSEYRPICILSLDSNYLNFIVHKISQVQTAIYCTLIQFLRRTVQQKSLEIIELGEKNRHRSQVFCVAAITHLSHNFMLEIKALKFQVFDLLCRMGFDLSCTLKEQWWRQHQNQKTLLIPLQGNDLVAVVHSQFKVNK